MLLEENKSRKCYTRVSVFLLRGNSKRTPVVVIWYSQKSCAPTFGQALTAILVCTSDQPCATIMFTTAVYVAQTP